MCHSKVGGRYGQHLVRGVRHSAVRGHDLDEHIPGNESPEELDASAFGQASAARNQHGHAVVQLAVECRPGFDSGNPERDPRDRQNCDGN